MTLHADPMWNETSYQTLDIWQNNSRVRR